MFSLAYVSHSVHRRVAGIPGPMSFLQGSGGISANRSLLGLAVGMLREGHVRGGYAW